MSESHETFKDYFSKLAQGYSAYRPTYPANLFTYLTSLVDTPETAWDCATGNGQAAVQLSNTFARVIATDGSEKQLAQAPEIPNINYRVATAEDSGLDDHSIDLITVAQALHWFDLDAFANEAKRVLKPDGILAAWTYNLLECDPKVDAIINHFYDKTVGEYWPFERKHVETGYRNITLPFTEHDPPHFEMMQQWTCDHLIGYLYTWSAVAAYEKANGHNPLEAIVDPIRQAWGDPDSEKRIIWPLSLRIWVN